MIDDYLTEIKYLKEFSRGSGLKQSISISGQVLASLGRIIQIHQLEKPGEYIEKDGKYFKNFNNTEEEINYEAFRINTFMEEYLNIQ